MVISIVFGFAILFTIIWIVDSVSKLVKERYRGLSAFVSRSLLVLVCIAWSSYHYVIITSEVPTIAVTHLDFDCESEPDWDKLGPKEGIKAALTYYNVVYPDIVYNQARLETGNFTSKVFKEYNNAFGLYDSVHQRYYRFNHWVESVLAYKGMIQSRYNYNQDYYEFLDSINYAKDETYISKLKALDTNREE